MSRGVEGQAIDRQLAFYRFNVDLPINIWFYTLSPNKCCISLNFALVYKYTLLVYVVHLDCIIISFSKTFVHIKFIYAARIRNAD